MKFSLIMSCTLQTIHALQNKYGKNYCFPSQKKIIDLLEKFHGVVIKRRQLNYILAYLEKEQFIDRKRRLKTSNQGKIIFNTTLYWLKKRAWIYLSKTLRTIQSAGLKLREVFKKSKKEKIPSTDDERYLISEEERRKNLDRLRLIFQSF